MDTSDPEGQKERWEAVHEAMVELVRERRFSDAAELLEREIADSRETNNLDEVAFFSSLRGSMLRILHRDDEALAAYRDAEAAAPEEANGKLAVAGELLKQNRPAEALVKVEEAEALLRSQPEWHHGVYGLLGVVYLALNREADAIRAFRELVRTDIVEGMLGQERIVRAFDLRLVTALGKRRLVLDEVRSYVEMVHRKAISDKDRYTADLAARILEDLDA